RSYVRSCSEMAGTANWWMLKTVSSNCVCWEHAVHAQVQQLHLKQVLKEQCSKKCQGSLKLNKYSKPIVGTQCSNGFFRFEGRRDGYVPDEYCLILQCEYVEGL